MAHDTTKSAVTAPIQFGKKVYTAVCPTVQALATRRTSR